MIKPANVINLVTLFLSAKNVNYNFTQNQTSNPLLNNSSDANTDGFDDYVNLFPKCCSKGFSYDSEDKMCIYKNSEVSILEELGIDEPVTLTYNWTRCPVRIDRFVAKRNLIQLNGSTKLVADNETYAESQFCIDKITSSNDYYIVRLCKDSDYCNNAKENGTRDWCLRKCCMENYSLQSGECVFKREPSALVKIIKPTFEGDRDNFAVFTPFATPLCTLHQAVLYNVTENAIKKDGTLVDKISGRKFTLGKYCLEEGYADVNQTGVYLAAITTCRSVGVSYYIYLLRATAALSSIGFLTTIMVYIFVYKLENIINILVVCVCTLSSIYWIKFNLIFYSMGYFGASCIYIAYISDFIENTIMTSTNVLTFEIWRTIGRTRSKVGDVQKNWLKIFVRYGGYVVAYPIASTFGQILMKNDIIIPSKFQSVLDIGTCGLTRMLKGNYFTLLFMLPQLILIVINVIFYIKTIRYVLKVKSDINKMINRDTEKQRKIEVVKTQAALVTKIGVISGIIWITLFFVPIYAAINAEATKYPADSVRYNLVTFLSLEGVYFFLVLCVKWEWIKETYQKLTCKKKQRTH